MTVRILQGDCREVLKTLPDESVHCIVSSPPYFGLRDYGTAEWKGGDPACDHVVDRLRLCDGLPALGERYRGGGKKVMDSAPMLARGVCPKCAAVRTDRQIGLEDTLDEFIETMVALGRELWRVLRPDGTLWLNLGDSYAGSWGAQSRGEKPGSASKLSGGQVHASPKGTHTGSRKRTGLKPKDLMGVPWRVALALQADGWWLRQEIIWHKPNAMPESTRDRCTKAHEQLFLLAKSGEPTIWRAIDTGEWSSAPDQTERVPNPSTDPEQVKKRPFVPRWRGFDYYYDQDAISEAASPDTHPRYARGRSDDHKWADGGPGGQTIARSFRHMADKPKVHAPKTVTSTTGSRNNSSFVEATGSGVVDRRNKRSVWTVATEPFSEAHFATYPQRLIEPCILAGCPKGGVVLDPFGGSGTTGLVAERLCRDAVLIELNPEYAAIADRRLRAGLAQVEGAPADLANDLPLFSGDAA